MSLDVIKSNLKDLVNNIFAVDTKIESEEYQDAGSFISIASIDLIGTQKNKKEFVDQDNNTFTKDIVEYKFKLNCSLTIDIDDDFDIGYLTTKAILYSDDLENSYGDDDIGYLDNIQNENVGSKTTSINFDFVSGYADINNKTIKDITGASFD